MLEDTNSLDGAHVTLAGTLKVIYIAVCREFVYVLYLKKSWAKTDGQRWKLIHRLTTKQQKILQ